MRQTRFLTRLATGTLVVAVAAGGGLLMGGVASAAPPAGSPGTATASALTATATTTTLTVAPGGSFPEGLPVALIAIVTPPDAEGTVQFKDGDTNIGDPATVLKGTSCSFGPNQETTVIEGTPCPPGSIQEITAAAFTITSTLTAGTYSLTAEFTPTDPSAFDSSAPSPVPFTVTAPILTEVSLLMESILGALPVSTEGFDRAKSLGSIHGGAQGDAEGFDRAKLRESIHGGLSF